MNVDSNKERLLCYSAGMLQAKLSNPNNTYTAENLIPSCIRAAQKLIDTIYNDVKLSEILKEKE